MLAVVAAVVVVVVVAAGLGSDDRVLLERFDGFDLGVAATVA